MKVFNRKFGDEQQYEICSLYNLPNSTYIPNVKLIAKFTDKTNNKLVVIGLRVIEGNQEIYTEYNGTIKIMDYISDIPAIPEDMKDTSLQILNEHIDFSDRIWTLEEKIIAFINNLK